MMIGKQARHCLRFVLFCFEGTPGEAIAAGSEREIFEIIGKDYVKPIDRNL